MGIVGAQFLKLEVGARSLAMGSASMATVNDASAIFWNPGGLTSVNRTSVVLSHMSWIAGINYEAAAIAFRTPAGVFGAFVGYLSSGEMEVTTVEDQAGTGETFKKTDTIMGVSWARKLTHNFSFGLNAKLVREDYGFSDDMSGNAIVAQAIAFDVGTQYQTDFRSLRMGLAIQHFGPEMKPKGGFEDIVGFDAKEQTYVTDVGKDFKAYPMPMTFRAGVAMELFSRENQEITLAVDVLHPSDNVERINIGAEYTLYNLLALRGGLVFYADKNRFDDPNRTNAYRFSFGAGISVAGMQIDYAFIDYGILSNVQTFSAIFNL